MWPQLNNYHHSKKLTLECGIRKIIVCSQSLCLLGGLILLTEHLLLVTNRVHSRSGEIIDVVPHTHTT